MKRIFSNSRSAYQLYRNRASVSNMIEDVFKGIYRPTLRTVLIALAGLIYIISPIDFIPDFIPVAGWADDGTILYLVIKQLKKEAERYTTMQNRQKS